MAIADVAGKVARLDFKLAAKKGLFSVLRKNLDFAAKMG